MSMPTAPLFAKSQDAYSTAVADQIAPAGYNAFTAVTQRRATPLLGKEGRKRGSRPNRAESVIASLRTDEERAHIRILAAARRVNKESFSGFSTTLADSAKTAKLIGRRNTSRTE